MKRKTKKCKSIYFNSFDLIWIKINNHNKNVYLNLTEKKLVEKKNYSSFKLMAST